MGFYREYNILNVLNFFSKFTEISTQSYWDSVEFCRQRFSRETFVVHPKVFIWRETGQLLSICELVSTWGIINLARSISLSKVEPSLTRLFSMFCSGLTFLNGSENQSSCISETEQLTVIKILKTSIILTQKDCKTRRNHSVVLKLNG